MYYLTMSTTCITVFIKLLMFVNKKMFRCSLFVHVTLLMLTNTTFDLNNVLVKRN